MVRPERPLTDCETPPTERLGFGKALQSPIVDREVTEIARHVRIVRSERLLADRQTALIERLGFGITALEIIQRCQVMQARGEIR